MTSIDTKEYHKAKITHTTMDQQQQSSVNVFAAYTSALDEKTRQFMEEAMRSSQGQFPLQWLQTFIRRLAAKDMELQDRERQVTEYVKAMNYSYSAASYYPANAERHDTRRYRPYENRNYRGTGDRGSRGGYDRGRQSGYDRERRGRDSHVSRGRSMNRSYYRPERSDLEQGDRHERSDRHERERGVDKNLEKTYKPTHTEEYEDDQTCKHADLSEPSLQKEEQDEQYKVHDEQYKEHHEQCRKQQHDDDDETDNQDLEDGEY